MYAESHFRIEQPFSEADGLKTVTMLALDGEQSELDNFTESLECLPVSDLDEQALARFDTEFAKSAEDDDLATMSALCAQRLSYEIELQQTHITDGARLAIASVELLPLVTDFKDKIGLHRVALLSGLPIFEDLGPALHNLAEEQARTNGNFGELALLSAVELGCGLGGEESVELLGQLLDYPTVSKQVRVNCLGELRKCAVKALLCEDYSTAEAALQMIGSQAETHGMRVTTRSQQYKDFMSGVLVVSRHDDAIKRRGTEVVINYLKRELNTSDHPEAETDDLVKISRIKREGLSYRKVIHRLRQTDKPADEHDEFSWTYHRNPKGLLMPTDSCKRQFRWIGDNVSFGNVEVQYMLLLDPEIFEENAQALAMPIDEYIQPDLLPLFQQVAPQYTKACRSKVFISQRNKMYEKGRDTMSFGEISQTALEGIRLGYTHTDQESSADVEARADVLSMEIAEQRRMARTNMNDIRVATDMRVDLANEAKQLLEQAKTLLMPHERLLAIGRVGALLANTDLGLSEHKRTVLAASVQGLGELCLADPVYSRYISPELVEAMVRNIEKTA